MPRRHGGQRIPKHGVRIVSFWKLAAAADSNLPPHAVLIIGVVRPCPAGGAGTPGASELSLPSHPRPDAQPDTWPHRTRAPRRPRRFSAPRVRLLPDGAEPARHYPPFRTILRRRGPCDTPRPRCPSSSALWPARPSVRPLPGSGSSSRTVHLGRAVMSPDPPARSSGTGWQDVPSRRVTPRPARPRRGTPPLPSRPLFGPCPARQSRPAVQPGSPGSPPRTPPRVRLPYTPVRTCPLSADR